jgi:protein phosphatase
MALVVSAATDLGRRRTQNEDSHAVWVPEDPQARDRRGTLLVVADGMGGAQGGEVASRIAVETVVRSWCEAPDAEPLDALRRAIEEANDAIHRESRLRHDLRGMGTTCTAVVLRGRDVLLAHVGDSRAYLVRGGTIRTLTRDHSLIAQLVADGHLTPEEARTDPRRNVVTRSVGVGERVDVDAEALVGELSAGDTVVLATDGLHGIVADEEIAALAATETPAEACRKLVELANQRGGPDNITVVVARDGDGLR